MISAICVSCRDEVAKAIRRAIGDNSGVKFRHGTYNFRRSWSNTIDTVLKDNLVLEIYNYTVEARAFCELIEVLDEHI